MHLPYPTFQEGEIAIKEEVECVLLNPLKKRNICAIFLKWFTQQQNLFLFSMDIYLNGGSLWRNELKINNISDKSIKKLLARHEIREYDFLPTLRY